MQVASRCVVFQILLDKMHLYFLWFLPFKILIKEIWSFIHGSLKTWWRGGGEGVAGLHIFEDKKSIPIDIFPGLKSGVGAWGWAQASYTWGQKSIPIVIFPDLKSVWGEGRRGFIYLRTKMYTDRYISRPEKWGHFGRTYVPTSI